MSDLSETIKEIAHSVSEDYLLTKASMNDAIFLRANELNLNSEITKRICELANQNVYLSLFHDASTNKANIQFDMADFNKINDKLQKSEQDMKEYKIVPKGFKTQLAVDSAKQEALEQSGFDQKKLASFDEFSYADHKLSLLLKSVETMKVASEYDAQKAFSQLFNDTKIMVSQGDSIADMAKIAMRHAKDSGFDMIKVAKVYDLVSKELKDNGYSVNEGLTKMSELAINKDSKLLQPIDDYMLGISKVAAFNEMCENIEVMIGVNELTKEAKFNLGKIKEVAQSAIHAVRQKIPFLKKKNIIEKTKDWIDKNKKVLGAGLALSIGSDILIGGTAGAIGGHIAANKAIKNQ